MAMFGIIENGAGIFQRMQSLVALGVSSAAAQGPQVWHWLIFIAVVGLTALLVVPAILKWQKKRCHAVYRVLLANRGNMRSRYALRATEPSGQLTFKFMSNGVLLREQAVVVGGAPAYTPTAAPSSSAPAQPARRQKKSSGGGLAGLSQTGGVLASLLTTVGSLFPSSGIGRSLTQTGYSIRRGQTMASQAQRASSYAGQLAPGKGKAGGGNRPQASAPAPPANPSSSVAYVGPSTGGEVEIWAQTPFIEPDTDLAIDLHVTPQSPYKTQRYTVLLTSKSVEVREPSDLVEQVSVEIEGLNTFERYAPFLLFITLLVVLLILFLSQW